MKTTLLVFLTTYPLFYTSAFASKDCVKIQRNSDACAASSIQVDLKACDDELIAIGKPSCVEGKIKFKIRAKNNDYLVTLKTNADAWGKNESSAESIIKVAHSSNKKSMPQTEHERPIVPAAAVTTTSETTATETPKKIDSAFLFSAYFDGYVEYNFNKPKPLVGTTKPQNSMRYYDFYHNQFVLNLAEITIKHIRKETSFIVDLDFGSFADANTVTATGNSSGSHTLSTADEVVKHIGQAVFSYTPISSPGWVFDFGKMPTHVGLELMKSKDNWNYSRSTIFSFGGPFWHTGAHVGYSGLNNFTLGAYLYNGWGTNLDNNFVPTYGAQLKWAPSDKLTWIYNYIGGPENNNDNNNWKVVHETNLSYTLTPTVSVATDILYGTQKAATTAGTTAEWFGVQLGMKWQTSPTFYISPRVEFYRDSDGFTLGGNAQSLYTYTLTQSYLVSEGFELRFEERLDHSTLSDRFIKNDLTSANQPSVLLSLLYTM